MANRHWLEQHLETFVRPYLGRIPDSTDRLGNSYWRDQMERGFGIQLMTLWLLAKDKSGERKILLPGRDVWPFEVFNQIDNEGRAIFRPDISTITSPFIAEADSYKEMVMIDTGYSGTCARMMDLPHWFLVSTTVGDHKLVKKLTQGSPNLTGCAGSMEGLPKYWDRAHMDGDPDGNSYRKYRWEQKHTGYVYSDDDYWGKAENAKFRAMPSRKRGDKIVQTLNASPEFFASTAVFTQTLAKQYLNAGYRDRAYKLYQEHR